MIVKVSFAVQSELNDVWRYNARRHDEAWADSYPHFLNEGIAKLSTEHDQGHPIEGFPELQSTTLRLRAGGDGHIAIYEVDQRAGTVSVLHVFHTKQDVLGRLRREQ